MRVSSFCLVVMAGSLIFVSGCKSRSQSGLKTFRLFGARTATRTSSIDSSIATRGTAACDCYVCRSKQDAKPYIVAPVGQPIKSDTQPVIVPDAIAEPDSHRPTVSEESFQPTAVLPDTDLTSPEATPPVLDPPPEMQQDVPSEVIEDALPANQLPAVEAVTPASPTSELEIEGDADVEIEAPADAKSSLHPAFRSSQINNDRSFEPNVASEAIPTAQANVSVDQRANAFSAKAFLKKASPANDPLQPKVTSSTSSIWFVPSAPAKTTSVEVQDDVRGSDRTIWEAPAETNRHADVEPALPVQTNLQAPSYSPVAIPEIPSFGETLRATDMTEEATPAKEPVPTPAKDTEMRDQSYRSPVVLHARPVRRHTIYNGRPHQAPVREARRLDGPAATGTFQLAPANPYFQQLPPVSQRIDQPASTGVAAPAIPAEQGSQFNGGSQTVTPAPAAIRQRVITAAPVATAIQPSATIKPTVPQPLPAPQAHVFRPTTDLLTLQAVARNGEGGLPPIASIQRMDQTVIGSLEVQHHADHTSGQAGQQATSGPARLMTSPWRPMPLGDQEDQQVRRSIRSLTIHPENISNAGRSTIDR